MADVAKIDIDGVQWDIKDQNARNRITTLETEVNTNIPERFTVDEKRIDGVYISTSGKSIHECCEKLKYPYTVSDITFAIDYVFKNPNLYPTGVYSVAVGGPAFLFIVQNLNSDFMSVIATGYSTPDIFKASKSNTNYSFGIISKTSEIN
ncbi:MAG: hypothetical protein KIG55_04860 [Myroides sp.]|nr:hypothetical protein [Myroides sp.]